MQDTSTKSREKQWANRLAVSTAWSDNDESDGEAEIADQEYKVYMLDISPHTQLQTLKCQKKFNTVL